MIWYVDPSPEGTVTIDPDFFVSGTNVVKIVVNEDTANTVAALGATGFAGYGVFGATLAPLTISKSSDANGAVFYGDTITYTIVVSNAGATAQSNVTVTDWLPAGVTYVPDSVDAVLDPPPGPGGSTSIVYNASSEFVVPAGVANVTVQVWGGGGGGGKATTDGNNAGGGGGGGGYARGSVAVTPGATNTVTVGTGGGTASAGSDSWFSSTSTVFAEGGGAGGVGTSVGAGGSANIGNQAIFDGGSGGGGATSGGGPDTRRGGGGGGSATPTADGGNGVAGGNNAGGGGGAGEGNGGSGTQGSVNSNPGNAFGGGGGGGGSGAVGGAGADGRVIITYDLPALAGDTDAPPNLATDWTLEPGSTLTITFEVTVDEEGGIREIINTASVASDQMTQPRTDTAITEVDITPTLAVITAVRSWLEDGVAVISWDVSLELDTVGYYLERWTGDAWLRVNADLIWADPFAPPPLTYEQADPGAPLGTTQRYRIVELDGTGRLLTYGPYDLELDGGEISYEAWAAGIDWGDADSSRDADPDGDGLTNWQEYLAGTNPLESNSVLRVTRIRPVDGGIELTWTSESERVDAVEVATSPNGPFMAFETDIPAAPPSNRYVVPVAPNAVQAAYFRVIVRKN